MMEPLPQTVTNYGYVAHMRVRRLYQQRSDRHPAPGLSRGLLADYRAEQLDAAEYGHANDADQPIRRHLAETARQQLCLKPGFRALMVVFCSVYQAFRLA